MGDIRGDKIQFRKSDIVSLDSLPSSQVENPLIVHCPARRGMLGRCLRGLAWLMVLMAVVLGLVATAIETGLLDQPLRTTARSAIQTALGPELSVEVGETSVRFSRNFHLAIVAEAVNLLQPQSGRQLVKTGEIRLVIDPLSLLRGRVSVTEVEASGMAVDGTLLRGGGGFSLVGLRIDQAPVLQDQIFSFLDEAWASVERSGLDRFRFDDMSVQTTDLLGRPLAITLNDLVMQRQAGSSLKVTGDAGVDGQTARFQAELLSNGGQVQSLTATLSDVLARRLMLKTLTDGTPRDGLDGAVDVEFYAARATDSRKPALTARVRTANSRLYLEGEVQSVESAELNLAYDFDKLTAEIRPSLGVFGNTRVPISGGLVDLDRLTNGGPVPGIGIDLLVDTGTAAAENSGEQPFPFSIKAFGRFLPTDKTLDFSELTVSTPFGHMLSTLGLRFGDQAPEIRFNAKLFEMRTTAVKQLWPFWMASKPRAWVMANLFGGTVHNGSLDVFIPAGRLKPYPIPLNLGVGELNLKFDISDARMNVVGTIPPLRDLAGQFELDGPHLSVAIAGGTSYFATGRKIGLEAGSFKIDNIYAKPLMAQTQVQLAGTADALAELVSYKPVQALQRTEFVPEDLGGNVTASIELYGGLISDQHPPPDQWRASVEMKGVDLKRPYMDRRITDFDGRLDVDPQQAVLDGKGQIDGVPMAISLSQPIDRKSTQQPTWLVKGKLGNAQRDKIVPQLAEVIDGPIDVEISRMDDGRQQVKTDLSAANITLPWLGWSKGAGISARLSLELQARNGQTLLDDVQLQGDGFGASGKMLLTKAGLQSADFSSVRLASGDDFGVAVQTVKGVTSVKLVGRSLDARTLFKKLKSGGGSAGSGSAARSGGSDVDVAIDLNKVIGFNDETLSGLKVAYGSRAGKMTRLNLSAVTDSGQAIVVQNDKTGRADEISVISGDAGDLARLVDLYGHMRGGLLDMRIRGDLTKNWVGAVDLRNFRVENEDRLQKIVSTPSGADGRSLNTAVKRDIDVSSEKFQRAFARLSFTDGVLRTDNGVVRGEQIGASFQGVIKDTAGQMDMTGTFMPAYGLNRLFAELPIIGTILGNGRDRGLLGITFKVTGRTEAPKLLINPLSIIAPGVFRQVFEFQ